jgi:hypothetical protein
MLSAVTRGSSSQTQNFNKLRQDAVSRYAMDARVRHIVGDDCMEKFIQFLKEFISGELDTVEKLRLAYSKLGHDCIEKLSRLRQHPILSNIRAGITNDIIKYAVLQATRGLPLSSIHSICTSIITNLQKLDIETGDIYFEHNLTHVVNSLLRKVSEKLAQQGRGDASQQQGEFDSPSTVSSTTTTIIAPPSPLQQRLVGVLDLQQQVQAHVKGGGGGGGGRSQDK